jgi:acyl-coenzyme A thioesterase PaaI-like protein
MAVQPVGTGRPPVPTGTEAGPAPKLAVVPADDPEPLFSPDGGRLVPSGHTRGPWDPRYQHGGPSAALVARAVEGAVGAGFTVTRLTIELLRPVALVPLTVSAQVTKPGRRVVRVEVGLDADGDPVVRASAVAVRHADLPVGADAPDDDRTIVPGPGPEGGVPLDFGAPDEGPVFHRTGMDVRIVAGAAGQPGPARAWFRLRRPVVAGEEPSPLQRAAAAADFCNGLSWALPFERWSYVNPDLTVQLARPPEGEWIALDARTVLSDEGTAVAEAELFDQAGRLGRAAQSLILESRVEA